ncbi:MAG TPA: hypothetical protein VHL79_06830 [Ramlibacter sp.]|jgi:hypothetical protein|nr:hypothetical protein [Ramlibacter sp.]
MMQLTLSRAFVLATVLAAGAAYAQKAAETSNTPQRAGEASTMTGGAPNKQTSNATDASGAPMAKAKKAKSSKSAKASASETSNTPQRAGEASTMTGGAPNKKTTN